MSESQVRTAIKVVVTFPLGQGPYQTEEQPDTTVGAIRLAAMNFFGVVEDPQYTFYLSHSGAPVDNSKTIGEIAGHAQAVKFTLVKEIVQGA